ncbi:unnamed protein product [Oikopleura dioica]|uniref:Uncharacterized protein n=1 Tax=Oikopleura dioica TaxID=34765 RepID=E4X6X6_OIKDI|nr:unnamed protein product [Oikopleura dioica]
MKDLTSRQECFFLWKTAESARVFAQIQNSNFDKKRRLTSERIAPHSKKRHFRVF